MNWRKTLLITAVRLAAVFLAAAAGFQMAESQGFGEAQGFALAALLAVGASTAVDLASQRLGWPPS